MDQSMSVAEIKILRYMTREDNIKNEISSGQNHGFEMSRIGFRKEEIETVSE